MADRDSDAPTKPDLPGGVPARTSYTLDARFEHIHEIARGGMGRVVEARDKHLGRIVAVKESLDNSPDAQMRFEREVAITARLEHPSIVPVYDAGVAADGTPFYVMRRVSGAPLDELIRKATTLDKRLMLLPHLLAVSDAIAHAHQRDVIHRDVKPSNVLVGDLGETIVIDWGLAKTVDESDLVASMKAMKRNALETAAGAVIGTPGFMAPEQVGGGTTDPRSDVYALGACLYFLLAGRTPFHGSNEDEVLDRTKRGAIDPLERVVTGVPRDLLTIVTKAMATDPAKRYLDAGGFSEDLRRFLGGQLVASHRYSPFQRAYRWLRNHRTAAVAVLGVAIAASISVVALRRLFHERERTAERSDDVVIVQATELVASDPTRAIATLQQLRPDSPRWASLGPLLADARARGIAIAYPGHDHNDVVHFSRGRDDRFVSSGNGIVRLTDLTARSSVILAEGYRAMKAWWCGPLVLVNPRSDLLRLIDPVTKRSEDMEWGTVPGAVAAADNIIAIIGAKGEVMTLDVVTLPITSKPVLVATVADAQSVTLSPSGQWLVVWATHRVQLFHRADGWKLATEFPFAGRDAAFDHAERRFTLRYDDNGAMTIIEIDLQSFAEARRWTVPGAYQMDYVGDRLFLVGGETVTRLDDGGKLIEVTRLRNANVSTLTDANGWLTILVDSRRIEITRGSFKRTIHAPLDLQGVRADHRGRYLVGFAGGVLLAWDLRDIVPQRLPSHVLDGVAFVDNDSIVASVEDPSGLRRIENYRFSAELAIVAQATLGKIPMFAEVVVLPQQVLVARDRTTNEERLVASDITRTDLRAITGLDAKTLVVGTVDGRVERVDRESGEATLLTQAKVPIAAVEVNGPWIVAQTDDEAGVVIRLKGTHEERMAMSATEIGLGVASDGTVYVARGRELVAWYGAGKPLTVAVLPLAIAAVRGLGDDRIALVTSDQSLHVYDPTTRATKLMVHGQFGTPGPDLDISMNGAFALSRAGYSFDVVDLRTGAQWSLADSLDPRSAALSPDGSTVIAGDDQDDALLRFHVTPPPATAAWVKAATNALPPRSANTVLEWRPL